MTSLPKLSQEVTKILILVAFTLISLNLIAVTSFALDILDFNSFYNRNITKTKIRNMIDASRHINSYESDATVNFTLTDPNSGADYNINSDLDINSSSIVNFLYDENEKLQFDLDLNGNFAGEQMNFDGNFRFVGNTFYGKIDNIPQEIINEDPKLAQLQGKWFAYQFNAMPQIREFFKAIKTGGYQSQVTETDLDNLIRFLHSNEFMANRTQSTFTANDGTVAQCINLSWNEQELIAMLDKYSEIYYGTTNSYSSSADSLGLGTTELSICTGRDFTRIYKTYFKIEGNTPEGVNFHLDFNQEYSGYNQNLDVQVPNAEINLATMYPQEAAEFENSIQEALNSANVNELQLCKNLGGDIFPDVTRSFITYDAISYAKNEGTVNGYADGCFRPSTEITRGQFVKIIVRANYSDADIAACSSAPYPDVATYGSFINEVCIAARDGILGGYSDGTFRGNNEITFGESSKIIANTYDVPQSDANNGSGNIFASYITGLENVKAIPESVACWNQSMLRGEITELLYRVDAGITNKASETFDGVNNCD